ncbi:MULTISPECIES: hypothetical protein [Acidiplasma]|jgi:hypothetical protein|uniref:Uncharacterized protein n=2 Tax=Acidiplasma TaxID=507753 RepID=A0A0Q0VMY6_9ARCH|nr:MULTISPECIES: hypothetical protein [Acidiplasma]KJE48869.1 hypothetical protein TZ01_06190 [Acidiplasma sp. MBA-1]KPV47006.1 hypothetical protein SE19_02965 [Acidiplasma aeolicum]KQB34802.1 hypothetical protein AOG55_00085 [Acidiplasma cupricumulans]KQB35057.1 hypothetical protein AOG54_03365 [Acidiplasma aeolicum]WMT54268.1 MAG: hypothetical protein RE470_04970 [Acidiplasma sp.]
MTENIKNDNILGQKAENVTAEKHTYSNEISDEELHLSDDDFDWKEYSIWKNPYALVVIIIAIWFSLWLFINVFMGRWFS